MLYLTVSINSHAFITVGNDNCDSSTIGDALVQAVNNADFELRIASNKIYFENLELDAIPVSLIGGYDSCADAEVNSFGVNKTQVDGSSLFKPVIVLENIANTANTIRFANLEIVNGLGNIINPSGGITIKDVDVQIDLENLFIHTNNSEKGGGLNSTRFDSTGEFNLIFIKDVAINSNTAMDGGGLYCAESQIHMYGESVIQSNQALGPGSGSREGDGGGIYVTANCQFNFYSGNTSSTLGIVSNTANGDGGGIYASNAAQVVLDGYQVEVLGREIGNTVNPVNITNNLTNFGDGAGIFAQDNATQVMAYGTIISFNSAAGSYGGGVAVDSFAEFTLIRKPEPCWDAYLCNQLVANKVYSSVSFPSFGGAVAATNLSNITIKQSIIYANQAEFGTSLALDSSSALIESSMIYKNGQNGMINNLQDKSAVDIINGSQLIIALTTFANNKITQSVINNNASHVSLFSSIVQDTEGVYDSLLSASEQFRCLLTHEDNSFNGNDVIVSSVDFVDSNNDDYHLKTPSMHNCESSVYQATVGDIDHNTRTNPYSHGADEFLTISLIFKNGFELN